LASNPPHGQDHRAGGDLAGPLGILHEHAGDAAAPVLEEAERAGVVRDVHARAAAILNHEAERPTPSCWARITAPGDHLMTPSDLHRGQ
jgi:hypothetical protein